LSEGEALDLGLSEEEGVVEEEMESGRAFETAFMAEWAAEETSLMMVSGMDGWGAGGTACWRAEAGGMISDVGLGAFERSLSVGTTGR
jgi:hypothetical protein